MGRHYTQLDLAERRRIASLLEARVPVAAIASQLGRHRSTIHREIVRNFSHTSFRDRWGQDYRGYYAVAGHGMAQQRRVQSAKLLRRPALQDHVVARLRDGWSPQQIAGRLRLDGHPVGYACHETIYRHIYGPVGRQDQLYALTARGRRQRRTRFGRKPRGAHIPTDQAIAARPPHIAARTEFGHWEGDLVIFGRRSGGGNVTSLQEWQSRFILLVGNGDRRSMAVAAGINTVLAPLPARARRSITFDRGTEFMGYAALRLMQSWFCDPHSPWQKGGIENANGRLRRYLPIDSTVGERSPDALRALTERLNTMPCRCLGYRTPAEVFENEVGRLADTWRRSRDQPIRTGTSTTWALLS